MLIRMTCSKPTATRIRPARHSVCLSDGNPPINDATTIAPRILNTGVTRTVHGEVEAGPNAVLAFAREGYRFGQAHAGELWQTLGYRGFWAMARRYWRTGSYEMFRSLSRRAFVRALQRLVPAVGLGDVARGGAGVRAQAVTPEGALVDDFRIVEAPDAVHVLNAPSPAATASLAIGQHIAGLAARAFDVR